MRYRLFASDYDGTIASDGRVPQETVEKLRSLKTSGRILVLVTGREMRYLAEDFPDYQLFDYIVAENGAVIVESASNQQTLLGEPPDPRLVASLTENGVQPLSVGQVIVATWEPHESTVLRVIKELGIERQVIFNKAAVMILPPGVNKATGLTALLNKLKLSAHEVVAVGDAENDTAIITMAECGAVVSNALPALKELADWVTPKDHGAGTNELIDQLLGDDLAGIGLSIHRHDIPLGKLTDDKPFFLRPYRSGLLISGVSGGGKTTFTLALIEQLIQTKYQFCLIDPEGDYLGLEGALSVGNENAVPSLEELMNLLKEPTQNLVICILSIPLEERPAYFAKFLAVYTKNRQESGRPHWLILDEAHHLLPNGIEASPVSLPSPFKNFVLVSTSVDRLSPAILDRVGLVFAVGNNWSYPFEHFVKARGLHCPFIPEPVKDQMLAWDTEGNGKPVSFKPFLPKKLLKRHKRKYAQGDMGPNSFVFTGPENKMNLTASNILLFGHLAEGIDQETWNFHIENNSISDWFRNKVHDESLADLSNSNKAHSDSQKTRAEIIDYINANYTS